MKINWKYVVFAILIIAAIVWSLQPKPTLVEGTKVTRGSLEVMVTEEGRTRVRDLYTVYTPVSGTLERIPHKPGAEVVAGETVLARIYPPAPNLIDARTLTELDGRVASAQAAVQRAKQEKVRAEKALELAQKQQQRYESLFAEGHVTEVERDQRNTDAALRDAELKTAEKSVDVALRELDTAKAARAVYNNGGNGGREVFELKAPISGRLFRLFHESTGFVTAGQQLMEIGDPTQLEVVSDLLSRDAVQVSPGDHVIFDHWGGELPLKGTVRLVEPSGFTKFSALGVEEQRVNVIMDFQEDPQVIAALGDGYRVQINIVVWQDDDLLLIPASALFRNKGAWSVFKIEDQKAHMVEVEIGKQNGLQAQVLSGLQEGELVINHPGDKVIEGVSVTTGD